MEEKEEAPAEEHTLEVPEQILNRDGALPFHETSLTLRANDVGIVKANTTKITGTLETITISCESPVSLVSFTYPESDFPIMELKSFQGTKTFIPVNSAIGLDTEDGLYKTSTLIDYKFLMNSPMDILIKSVKNAIIKIIIRWS